MHETLSANRSGTMFDVFFKGLLHFCAVAFHAVEPNGLSQGFEASGDFITDNKSQKINLKPLQRNPEIILNFKKIIN